MRLSIPKLVKEVLMEDMAYFNLKKDRVCNVIVKEMGYSSLLKLHENLKLERKLVINFNLNERNTRYFKDMVKLSKKETEAEFLRSLLSTYANFHPFLREKVLYKVKFKELEQAIKCKEQIRAEIEGEILELEPLGFSRDEVSKYAILKFQVGKKLFDQRVKDIEILKI